MTRPRQFTLILVPLLALLVGCYIQTELKITNHSGQPVKFYTEHTKKTVEIPVGATLVVPHTSGTLTVTTRQGMVWQYESLDVPDPKFDAEIIKGRKRLTLPITLDSKGVMRFPSGKKVEPFKSEVK